MSLDPWSVLAGGSPISRPRRAGKTAEARAAASKAAAFQPVIMIAPRDRTPADAAAIQMIYSLQEDVRSTMDTERSRQKQIGLSEIGDPCDLCVARKLSRLYDDMPDSPSWKAQVGTFIHAGLEEHFVGKYIENGEQSIGEPSDWDDYDGRGYPARQLQAHSLNVGPLYASERRVEVWTYKGVTYGGSCDLYTTSEGFGMVVDWKTQGPKKLASKTAKGDIGQTYTVQMMLYGLGHKKLGLPVTHVLLYALPRDGELDDAKPVLMRYDEQIAVDALKRIKNMVDAAELIGWPAVINAQTSPRFCFGCNDFRKQENRQSDDFLFGNIR